MSDGPDAPATHPIVAWLTFEQRWASQPFSDSPFIQASRERTAVRFLESHFQWSLQVGYVGTAIILDDSRIPLSKNPRDGKVFYTHAMAPDHYELLREPFDYHGSAGLEVHGHPSRETQFVDPDSAL